MRLDHATWPEVAAYLQDRDTILLPTGSNEQHGPMGLIGTDAICAEAIATGAADRTGTYVAPTLAYTPAPFNTAFPGTMSISVPLFRAMLVALFEGLVAQGFARIYVLNGHGANLEPLRSAAAGRPGIRIRSWWDFEPVNRLRRKFYGDWEGMHATPSEVAITQALIREVRVPEAEAPPEKLSAAYMKDHADDRHGLPDAHRAAFPDGRVGSHSDLARPEHGRELLATAIEAVAEDVRVFSA